MSIRTIALTLKPTDVEARAFARLQSTFNDACNYINGVAWEAQEFNSVRLHRLVYYDVRARYGLRSQHVVRAIGVVADSYKRDRNVKRAFRKDAAVVLDTPRLYRLRSTKAAITTLDGRLTVTLNIGGIQRAQLGAALKLAEADLIRDRKGRWRLLVSAHYADPPLRETNGVLGVDLGRTDIAVSSDGDRFSGAQVTAVRDRYTRHRQSRQAIVSKGTRSTRRRVRQALQRLSGRERRFQQQVNHTISHRLVAAAASTGRAIALEDLTGIRDRTNTQPRGKTERRRSNSWAFYQLRGYITYKCVDAGIPLVLVNPAYTSQMCSRCLHIGRRAGKSFRCGHCGVSCDADVNGAKNIALLGAAVTSPGGSVLCCWYQPDARATESLAL